MNEKGGVLHVLQRAGCGEDKIEIIAILEWNGCSAAPSARIVANLKSIRAMLVENSGRSIRVSKAFRQKYTRGFHRSSLTGRVHDLLGDACTSYGIGFVNLDSGEFMSRAYTNLERRLIGDQIFVGEAIATFLMFMSNRHLLRQVKLNLWGDNEGLVRSFHKCGSTNRVVDEMMRIMVAELVVYNIDPVGDTNDIEHSWCSTKSNVPYGDALSRNDVPLFLQHFRAHHSNTHISPVQLTHLNPPPSSQTFSPQLAEAEQLLVNILTEQDQWIKAKLTRRATKKNSAEMWLEAKITRSYFDSFPDFSTKP